MPSWIITIPKTTSWDEYRRELDAVEEDPGMVLNYRVAHFPKAMKVGDRLYVTWKGIVRGWMTICGMDEFTEGWHCVITGAWWKPGKYIQRKAPFHTMSAIIPHIGFRGVRKFERP